MLTDFIGNLTTYGTAKPSHYKVEFVGLPIGMSSRNRTLAQDLEFFVESAELPGQQLITQDHRVYDMSVKMPTGKVMDDVTLVFRMDNTFLVKNFIDNWIGLIYNDATGNVRFRNTYIGVVKITQYGVDGNPTYSINLEEAYPMQAQSLSLGWDQGNALHKLSTIWTYRRWAVTDLPVERSSKVIDYKGDNSQLNVSNGNIGSKFSNLNLI